MRSKTEGMTLTKALFNAYLKDFSIILLFLLATTALAMFNPFLTAMIMDYIDQDAASKSISYG